MSPIPPLDQLRRALPGLPRRLREIGQFLAEREFDATTQSMRGLAAKAGVTPATFTRLAQALGYSGWDALRAALIEARRPESATPFSGRVAPTPLGGRPDRIAAEMIQADAVGLRRLASDAPDVDAAAAALDSAKRIWVAGFRSCRSVAALLHYQLRLFRPDTVRLVGGAGPEDLDLGEFRPGDAVVVIGFIPYSKASVVAARAALAAGCSLIVVADTATAPIALGAQHLLQFAAGGPGFFPSLTGAVALAQALAAAAFDLGGADALERLRATEETLAAHSQYVPDEEADPS